ncbi:MAG: polysaccharide pyruvyl transferase family protein, partial [Opitutaceae bacterium]|nr:polysaccharide pyruvyl transferase family protein [Opitutaceae bacterium]
MTQTAVSAAISSTNEDRRSRVVRIAILGTPLGNRNRGVMALASSLVKLLAEASDRTEFTFLDVHAPLPDTYFHCGERKVRATVTTCRMSLKGGISNHLFWIFFLSLLYRILPVESIRRSLARSSPWIAAIRNADIVGDVRGGDSFSDIYGLARFLTGSVCSASVLLVKGSLIHFPQTYGPFKSRAGKSVARALLKRSGVVIARDKRSYEAAEEIIGSSQNLRLSPDVAFAMDAVRPERLEFDKSGFDIGAGGIIGINFNALMFNGG